MSTETTFDFKAVRTRLHEQVTNITLDESEGIVGVTGWIVLVETTHPDGVRGLYAISGDTFGEMDLAPWHAKGMLDEVSGEIDCYIGPDSAEEEEDE